MQWEILILMNVLSYTTDQVCEEKHKNIMSDHLILIQGDNWRKS